MSAPAPNEPHRYRDGTDAQPGDIVRGYTPELVDDDGQQLLIVGIVCSLDHHIDQKGLITVFIPDGRPVASGWTEGTFEAAFAGTRTHGRADAFKLLGGPRG